MANHDNQQLYWKAFSSQEKICHQKSDKVMFAIPGIKSRLVHSAPRGEKNVPKDVGTETQCSFLHLSNSTGLIRDLCDKNNHTQNLCVKNKPSPLRFR